MKQIRKSRERILMFMYKTDFWIIGIFNVCECAPLLINIDLKNVVYFYFVDNFLLTILMSQISKSTLLNIPSNFIRLIICSSLILKFRVILSPGQAKRDENVLLNTVTYTKKIWIKLILHYCWRGNICVPWNVYVET